MRKNILVLALALFSLPGASAWAQKEFVESKPSANTISCRTITLHCDCSNPPRKFTVKDLRVGRVNPGEPGICQSSVYIDGWLQKNRFTACVRGGQEGFDPSKPPACEVTWTCKDPC